MKDKHDDHFTCRIAAMGDRLEPLLSSETFASVFADGSKNFAIATMQAYCASRGEVLHISDADVVGGFLMGQIQSFQASIAWLYLGLQPSFRANQNKGKPALSYLDALKIITHLKVNVFLHSR